MTNICSTIRNDTAHADDIRITVDIIKTCIKKLKRHKDDGKHGFHSDHLIHGSNRMFVILCLMFNSMLTHGYTPDDLLLSTIIYIPKDNKGSMSSSDNYRDISMSNSLCKLFDYIFIELNADSLKTDDKQFGFKRNHSTVLFSAFYIETINHYVNEVAMYIAVL